MGALFSKPKMPDMPAAPGPAPTASNSASTLEAAERDMAARLQRGRASTLLTGAKGVDDNASTSKLLLGQ